MRPRLEICLDTTDPDALVAFWCAALGYVEGGRGGPYVDVRPPDGEAGPILTLQRVPEAKAGKNRLHLDLYLADPAAAVAAHEVLGATRIGEPVGSGRSWFQVMADPQGNEYCLCAEHQG